MKALLTEQQLGQGVQRLADEIAVVYDGRPLTIIGILTGSVVLLADLIRRLDMPLRVGVIQTSSYRGSATRPGPLEVNSDFLPEVRGRDVLLVDDIFDSGKTLAEVIDEIDELGPKSIRSAVLLRKDVPRKVRLQPDHVAFDIPDQFVVGYGLDYNDAYRNLPYVAVLEEEDLRRQPPVS